MNHTAVQRKRKVRFSATVARGHRACWKQDPEAVATTGEMCPEHVSRRCVGVHGDWAGEQKVKPWTPRAGVARG